MYGKFKCYFEIKGEEIPGFKIVSIFKRKGKEKYLLDTYHVPRIH